MQGGHRRLGESSTLTAPLPAPSLPQAALRHPLLAVVSFAALCMTALLQGGGCSPAGNRAPAAPLFNRGSLWVPTGLWPGCWPAGSPPMPAALLSSFAQVSSFCLLDVVAGAYAGGDGGYGGGGGYSRGGGGGSRGFGGGRWETKEEKDPFAER